MLAFWLGYEALVIGVNLVIDPLGISPIQVRTRLNALKPLRNGNDALVKRYEVDRRQPRTVFVGSSRTKQSIDPSLLNGTIYGPAYNAGVDGGSDPADIESLLDHYFQTNRNLRYAFIEIFATAVVSLPGVRPLEEDGFLKRLDDWSRLFNSYGGLSYSLKTAAYNLAPPVPGDAKEVREDGFSPIPNGTTHFSVYNIPNFITYTDTIPSGKKISPEVVPALTRLIDKCKSDGVECSFIITPLHADVLYGAYLKGEWEELEALKRTLASLAPTWDFTRYNSLIDERDGEVVYWPEAFHYSPALGALMLRRISGPEAAALDLPVNFGVLIDPHRVDYQLAAWRAERDTWIARHAGVVARYRAAAESKRRGLTFTEVTDALARSYMRDATQQIVGSISH